MAINKESIKSKVIKGRLEEAIADLIELTNQYDNRLNNYAIMLSGRFHSLQNDINMGTSTGEQRKTSEARLLGTITSILDDVEEHWTIGEAPKDPEGPASSGKRTILFLGANPKDTVKLRLDEEVRKIKHSLERSQKRDSLKLEQEWAVQFTDLRRALMEKSPNIVHFSGHGSDLGKIYLEDISGNGVEIKPEALGDLIGLFKDSIECVVLNACYSETQAQEISKHIKYVVGMNTEVPDKAAIEFAEAFYDGVANGRDFEFAFKLGRIAVDSYDLDSADIPVLIKK